MKRETLTIAMTTWPPRWRGAIKAFKEIARQRDALSKDTLPVRCVLVLSKEEWAVNNDYDAVADKPSAAPLLEKMQEYGVEVLWDDGNIKCHKKLQPVLERYPDDPLLVTDDDIRQQDDWLATMIADHIDHPEEIIYGQSMGGVYVVDGKLEERRSSTPVSEPGNVSFFLKPASGSPGTLYPSGTFTDPRFFDRELFMRICPTDDESWQFAFALLSGRTFRCASACNIAFALNECVVLPLFDINKHYYNDIHNRIADVLPEYKHEILRRNEKERCNRTL